MLKIVKIVIYICFVASCSVGIPKRTIRSPRHRHLHMMRTKDTNAAIRILQSLAAAVELG